jgi:chromosome segregation ATPase
MNYRQASKFAFALFAVMLIGSVGIMASVQTAPAGSDTITALLSEVKALRIAMEKAATVGPRMQLTLARLNIEEQRTLHLYTQLTQIRKELDGVVLHGQQLVQALLEIQNGINKASDDKEKRAMMEEEAECRRQMTANTAFEQQLRGRESEIAQSLKTEQDRWTDLNSRLDELERLLGPAR